MAVAISNPLQARLDGKGFLQLTLWFAVVLAAYLIAKWLVEKGRSTAAQAAGKASASGMTNPFFAQEA